MGVALQSGRTPTEFWSLDRMDQAYMIAYYRTVSVIEGYKAEKERQKSARASRKKR